MNESVKQKQLERMATIREGDLVRVFGRTLNQDNVDILVDSFRCEKEDELILCGETDIPGVNEVVLRHTDYWHVLVRE
jgi:hypothetical protein